MSIQAMINSFKANRSLQKSRRTYYKDSIKNAQTFGENYGNMTYEVAPKSPAEIAAAKARLEKSVKRSRVTKMIGLVLSLSITAYLTYRFCSWYFDFGLF